MNDEITKNIIYRLDCKSPTSYDGIELSKEESNLLLDYITNLQQDNTMYAQLEDEYEEEIKDLQQENEKLKESNGELTNRNVKASVYILENIKGNYFKRYDDEIYKMCDDLLEILKGE